jgi:membrane-bound lytic murein transglycosylase B
MSFENWVERLRNQAFAKGISIETLQNTFLQNQQLDLSEKPVQSSTTITPDFMRNHLTFCQLLLNQYGDTLFEISHLFGVSIEVLVAITSLENEATSSFSAIDILINQSFLHPRDISLQNELLQALKIIDEGQVTAQQLKSDIHGKLGKTRFKPTVFRDNAIDFDGDGQFDIWTNYADIFASTANYLSSIGWQTGKPWGIEVELPEEFNSKFININEQKSLSKWQSLGILQANGNELPLSTDLGSLIQASNDRYYIVLDNYFTLLRWKRSKEFALSIGLLIDALNPEPQYSSPEDTIQGNEFQSNDNIDLTTNNPLINN